MLKNDNRLVKRFLIKKKKDYQGRFRNKNHVIFIGLANIYMQYIHEYIHAVSINNSLV